MRQSRLNQKAAEKLDAAADDIERNEKATASYGLSRPDAPKCMLGAINYAIFGHTIEPTYTFSFRKWQVWYKSVESLSDTLLLSDRSRITTYSDTHTASEAILALRQTAANLREG
jgi:hypothetical protein